MDYDRLRELQEKFDKTPRRYFAPLANEYRKGGQPKRAIELCRAHLAQMPGHMSGQIVYGQSLYEAGEFDEAKEVFGRALSLDPENLIALRSLGDMALQAGDTADARKWYTRLLDADPKDTAMIALVSEIDAANDATPVDMARDIPGVDTDAGDQEIPADLAQTSELVFLSAESNTPTEAAAPAPAAEEAPIGLERHYPVQEPSPAVPVSAQSSSVELPAVEPLAVEPLAVGSPAVQPPAAEAPAQAASSEGPRAEELGVPAGSSAAEGLTSVVPEAPSPLRWAGPPPDAPVEEPAPAAEPVAAAAASPPEATAPEPPRSVERTFSGARSATFVNETMAQAYVPH